MGTSSGSGSAVTRLRFAVAKLRRGVEWTRLRFAVAKLRRGMNTKVPSQVTALL